MIVYRLKSNSIVYDLYLPTESNGKIILYVPGLPGHPRRKILGETFVENGFVFFEMRFPGSWESDGVFTMDNCVRSLEEAHAFIRQGAGIELRRNARKEWGHNEIILLGSSFGGGVILSSQIKAPLTFVLLAPVTRLQHVNDSLVQLPTGEDDLFHLLSKGYANVYRGLAKDDWNKFLSGETLINPRKNINNLRDKKLLFFQGMKDVVIQSEHTSHFVRELKEEGIDVKLLSISDAEHGGDLEEKAVQSIIEIFS